MLLSGQTKETVVSSSNRSVYLAILVTTNSDDFTNYTLSVKLYDRAQFVVMLSALTDS